LRAAASATLRVGVTELRTVRSMPQFSSITGAFGGAEPATSTGRASSSGVLNLCGFAPYRGWHAARGHGITRVHHNRLIP
jgi:hypothetical protein